MKWCFKGGENMEELTLTAATWAWLLIPMPVLIVLSIITYFTEKKGSNLNVEKEMVKENGY